MPPEEDKKDYEASYVWEDDDGSLPEILPEEVLGWLLMRRSSLSSSARLAIGSSPQHPATVRCGESYAAARG